MLAQRGRNSWYSMAQGLALLLTVVVQCICGWRVDYAANRKISVLEDSDVVRFRGESSTPDFATVLIDGDSLFVGARNVFYNLNVNTLATIKKSSWPVAESASRNCLDGLQKSEVECQNYIRVIAKWSNGEVFICGTNALNPVCRTYKNSPHYDVLSSQPGVAICPLGPNDSHSYTVVDKMIYSATYIDMSSTDSVISNGQIRTVRNDVRWFNEPQFVSSFEYQDKVYFFFRETALEHSNCGKNTYSRVARVCKKDTGGRRLLQERFTSFLKTRLNCSVPGKVDFNFDEIVDTSSVGRGNVGPSRHSRDAQDIVYGLFNTPQNSITGGAICAFRLSDVTSAFRSKVMTQPDADSFWRPFVESPPPNIDECANDSKTTLDERLNFVKSHPLMEQPVSPFGGRPIYLATELRARMTKLTVDWQVPAADGHYYDIIYIGTDDGRVLKVYNKDSNLANPETAVTVEDIQVATSAILNLQIHARDQGQSRLIVTSKEEVVSLPLHRCESMKSCSDCVKLQDPYCSWVGEECRNSRNGYQNLVLGKHSQCPSLPDAKTTAAPVKPSPCQGCKECPPTTDKDNDKNNQIPTDNKGGQKPSTGGDTKNNTIKDPSVGASRDPPQAQITLYTFILSVLASSVVCSVLFFTIGYCWAYRRSKSKKMKYLDKFSDTSERSKAINSNSDYATTPGTNKLNVLKNVAPKISNTYTVPSPIPEHKMVLSPGPDHNLSFEKGMLTPSRKAYV